MRLSIQKNIKILILITLLCFWQRTDPALSQEVHTLQFINQPITDILMAIAEVWGKTIIPDETVSGYATFTIFDMPMQEAFELFLKTYKMYYQKDGEIYNISRIFVQWEETDKVLNLDAEDVPIPLVIRAASKAMNKTIIFDPLPSDPITLHIKRLAADKFLAIVLSRYAKYKVVTDPDYYKIVRIEEKPEAGSTAGTKGSDAVVRSGDLYTVNLEKVRFKDLLYTLFEKAERQYSLFIDRDIVIDRLKFSDKKFDELLKLILEQASADFTVINDIYYIFEISDRDILKKLKTTVLVPLTYISVKDLPNLFPPDLLSSKFYKTDLVTNSMILYGSVEEIAPIIVFIKLIDKPMTHQEYYVFALNHLKAAEIKSALPPEFKSIEPIVIPGTNSFVVILPKEVKPAFEAYINLIDNPDQATPIWLKFIQAEELLKKLPPNFTDKDIIQTQDPNLIFVIGTPKRVSSFIGYLKLIDVPAKQLRYQFLVVQYQEGHSLGWNTATDKPALYKAEPGDSHSFTGNIGNLLNLNFDVISNLGYQFALNFSMSLGNNTAQVIADTNLLGLSGEEVKFQNTETFRYREIETDQEGNTSYTGVSREIQAGIIINIKGWISGDGMITVEVSVTVSKKGQDSTSAGGLPSTSENVITTKVRSLAGEPVVIGGMIRREYNEQIDKIPFLGDIPLLGLLFQSKSETLSNTELVIYIVPYIDYSYEKSLPLGMRLEALYDKFLNKY